MPVSQLYRELQEGKDGVLSIRYCKTYSRYIENVHWGLVILEI